jgi:hypothetical protein
LYAAFARLNYDVCVANIHASNARMDIGPKHLPRDFAEGEIQ